MDMRFEAANPKDLASLMDEQVFPPDVPLSEGPGTRIGRYKLLQLIGEGGFGSVFMAEQETPVVRRVALKIIKLGMDTRQVIARFEAERQALAMMDHPNIARVLDAGATETGRPYFVMELVPGIPINQYCDRKRLTPRQRIELFLPVCRAIQHAHQKGLIHRDLKPSNVLVMTCDGQGVPKVIDFGVAKAIHQRLTEKTLFTQFGNAIGTPEYMSPEQADMDVMGADTRSDIYSLGVLLYELLTGSTPFDRTALREAGYAQMLRIIREQEPPTPSTRLSQSGEALASISADRGTDPKDLTRMTAGDLDWIVMKCLEKDRARRYETADGLARDIERYLKDEPVEASPPSTFYKLRKLARRHKGRAVAIVAVAAALVVGIIGTSLGLAQARHNLAVARSAERREASQREQAEAVAGILDSIFHRLDPYAVREGGADLRAQLIDEMDRIAAAPQKYAVDEPLIRARLLDSLGWTQLRLGEIAKAQALLQSAIAERNRAGAPDDAQKYQTLSHLGVADYQGGQRPEAIKLLEQVRVWQEKHLGPDARDTLATSYWLALSYAVVGRYSDAIKLFEHVRDRQTATLGPDDPDTLRTLVGLAATYRGASQKQIKLLQQVRDQQSRALGADHPDTLHTECLLAKAYLAARRNTEALSLLTSASERQANSLGPAHPDTIYSRNSLADAYQANGRVADAIRLLEQLRDLEIRTRGPDDPATDWLTSHLASMYEAGARINDAVRMFEQLRDERLRKWGPDDPKTLAAEFGLAGAYQDVDSAATIRLLEDVRNRRIAKLGPDHPDVLDTLAHLGHAYVNVGRPKDAIAILEQVREKAARIFGPEHNNTLDVMDSLAFAYLRARETQKAMLLLEQVREITARTGNVSQWRSSAHQLGWAYIDLGRPIDAIKLLEPVRDDLIRQAGPADFDAIYTSNALARAYEQTGRMEDAIQSAEQVYRGSVQALGPENPNTLLDGFELSVLYAKADRQDDELRLLEQLHGAALRVLPPEDPRTLKLANNLVIVYWRLGRTAEALKLAEPLRQSAIRTVGAGDPFTIDVNHNLMVLYRQLRRDAEALLVGKSALQVATKSLGPDDPKTIRAMRDLDDVLRRTGQSAEARKLSDSILGAMTRSIAAKPDDPDLLVERADFYGLLGQTTDEIADLRRAIDVNSELIQRKPAARESAGLYYSRAALRARLGDFQNALADFRRAVELNPDEHSHWHDGFVPMLLQVADVAGYRHWRSEELRRFEATSDAAIAHRVSKDALMLPADGEDIKIAVALADRAYAKDHGWPGNQTRGMAEYRSGHFKEAIPFLIKCRDLADEPRFVSVTEFFLAMSYERSNNHPEALAAFQRGLKELEQLPKADRADDRYGGSDWILAHLARDEAAGIVGAATQD